jgi:NAD(P)-dependent dehydrogenase (short-subunit alcohol dehydrogenase family)
MSKVWLITGAGSGIGTGIAKAALESGDRVVATGRNLDKVRNALRDVTSENLAFVQLDVSDEVQAKQCDRGLRGSWQRPRDVVALSRHAAGRSGKVGRCSGQNRRNGESAEAVRCRQRRPLGDRAGCRGTVAGDARQ